MEICCAELVLHLMEIGIAIPEHMQKVLICQARRQRS